jgi:hypothetical protein
MSGLEGMGLLFLAILGVGLLYIFIWLFGSVWRHGDKIDMLEAQVRMIENALLTSNPPSKKENKNGRQSIRKPNRRTR